MPLVHQDSIGGGSLTNSLDAVRREWEQARRFLDLVAHIIVGLDREGRIARINRAGCCVLGYAENELLGEDWFATFLPPGVGDEVRRRFAEVVAGTRTISETYENPIRTRDGAERLIAWRNTLIRSESGTIQGTLSSGEDITERRHAEDALRATEGRYRMLFERNLAGVFRSTLDGRSMECNEAFASMFGYASKLELLSHHAADLYPTPAHRVRYLAELRQKRELVNYEIEMRRKDGSVMWGLENVALVRETDGTEHIHGTVIDVSEWKLANEALHAKEHLLSESQRIGHIGSWTYDQAGRISWSDEAYRIWGVSPDTFVPNAASFLTLIHPDDRPAMQAWIDACWAGEKPRELEFRIVSPDGTVRFLSGCGELQCDAANHPTHMAGTVQDITERKNAELALRSSEEKFRFFVEHVPAAVAMFDRDMRYLAVSQRWLVDHRLHEQSIIGRSHYDVFPDIPDRWKEVHHRCLTGTSESCDEDQFVRADGSLDWIRWTMHPWRQPNNEIGGAILFSEVTTARKKADAALRESEEWLRIAVQASNVGLWDWDLDSGKINWTKEHAELFGVGLDQFDGSIECFQSLIHPDDRECVEQSLQQAMSSRTVYSCDFRTAAVARSEKWVRGVGRFLYDHTGKPVRIVGVILDITETRTRAAAQEMEARKTAIAGLAVAVAHEFSNTLMAVSTILHGLGADVGLHAQSRDSLFRAERALGDLQVLSNAMLMLRRDCNHEEQGLNLVEFMTGAAERLRTLLGSDMAVRLVKPPPDLPCPCHFRATVLDAVFRVLAVNAKDANATELRIECRSEGDFVLLSVRDNGHGISPEVSRHLFAHPYSTKASSERYGLGLTIALELVEAMGGTIWHEACGDAGALFVLSLPRAYSAVEQGKST